MNLRRLWFLLTYYILRTSSDVNMNTWIMYSKDPKEKECFVIDFRHYCRPIAEDHSKTSCVHGTPWTFSYLEKNHVTTDELVRWIIPFNSLFYMLFHFFDHCFDDGIDRTSMSTTSNSRKRDGSELM